MWQTIQFVAIAYHSYLIVFKKNHKVVSVKVKERFDLIFKVAKKISDDFDLDDIHSYFGQFGLRKLVYDQYQSTFDFAKGVLTKQSEKLVLEIAQDVGITSEEYKKSSKDSSYWKPNHFKLFLSHKTSIKEKVSHLSSALHEFGITSFVAHEDIAPSSEWQTEIENALYSMEALVALITDDYSDSEWTDQEVGFALGRDIPVIPVAIDKLPYGFLGKIQAVKAKGRYAHDVALDISEALIANPTTYQSYTIVLADLFITSSTKVEAIKWLEILEAIKPIPIVGMEKIKHLSSSISFLTSDSEILIRVNALLAQGGLDSISFSEEWTPDDIPF